MMRVAIARLVAVLLAGLGVLVSLTLCDALAIVTFVPNAVVGTFLVWKRPGNAIGWLLLGAGWGLALGSARVEALPGSAPSGQLAASDLVAWANGWGWSLFFLSAITLASTYPSGHMPSGRGGGLARAMVAAGAALSVLMAIRPTVGISLAGTTAPIDVPNPLAIFPQAAVWELVPEPSMLYASLMMLMVTAVASLVGRYRAAQGLERLQYRWLVWAIALAASASLGWAALVLAFNVDNYALVTIVLGAAMGSIPVAVGVAVLRYRLYDIDRIISRTIGWALVTGILVAVFAAGVLGLQAVMAGFTQGETLAVAASTLVAFALFQPLRRRVQVAVDRRFDRARYDGERVVVAFSERMRDRVELTEVEADIATTVRQALRPGSVTVWVRTEAQG
jgi:hypothetical protein